MCVLDFCLFARPRKKYYREFFFWSQHNTTRTNMILDFSRSGDRATAKAITLTCVFFFFFFFFWLDDDFLFFFRLERSSFASFFMCRVVSRHGTHASIFGRYSFSLSLSPTRRRRRLLLHRDVQETCVKLGFLYPNAKTSDPVQRRADCVTMFRVVGCTCASTLFWCLSPPRPFLSPFFFSLSSARAVHATTCVRTMVCVCLCGVY